MITAIVFDFDGVIADSEPLHLRSYQEVLAPLGIVLSQDAYYTDYLGYDDVGVFSRLGAAHGVEMNAARIQALIAEKSDVYDALIESTDVLYPGAAELIERLSAEFPLGIASGALKHEIVAILSAARLHDYFRFIVASGDTPESKPAPDPYRRSAELHGVAADECLAIEDSHWGIQSAKAAGLWCIAVPHTYPATALDAADLVVPSLDAITSQILRSIAS